MKKKQVKLTLKKENVSLLDERTTDQLRGGSNNNGSNSNGSNCTAYCGGGGGGNNGGGGGGATGYPTQCGCW